MKPTKSILDKSFVYRDHSKTDVTQIWRKYGWLPKCELPEPRTVVSLMPKDRKAK
jgi:hypothetical protein